MSVMIFAKFEIQPVMEGGRDITFISYFQI
jgi:hypothetical protein